MESYFQDDDDAVVLNSWLYTILTTLMPQSFVCVSAKKMNLFEMNAFDGEK